MPHDLTLRILDSLTPQTRSVLYCNLVEVLEARREGRDPVTERVPFGGRRVGKRRRMPEASPETRRAHDRKKAADYRARKRQERIEAGWVPPEEREYKGSPEKRAADAARARQSRERRRARQAEALRREQA